ncbi:helix-turn-helix domain-containing protein [Yeosuana sp. AK3]
MSILFSVAIIILVFRMILIYEKGNSNYSMSNVIIETKWLKKILYIGLLLCILWFVSLNLFEGFFNKGYYKFYSLWIGMAILIYWMGYSAILQKQLFNERKEIRKRKISNNDENPSSYSKIDSLIINNKLHLVPTLSLRTLSNELNLSEGYISQLINRNSNLNFNDYINLLRVNDAKNMLMDSEYDNYTVLSIGLEAGFNSKSSFYSAFKKFTSKTPIEFKKDVRNL